MFDVAIIGAGPAGCAAAICIKGLMPSASVAMFDSRPKNRSKPGEILSPEARPILESLGCADDFAEQGFLESFGTRAAWGGEAAYENDFLYAKRGSGWRLDRDRFDQMLRERAVAAGAEIYEDATLVDSNGDGAGWLLSFRKFERGARFAIDASGRRAIFAMHRGARRLADDRLAAAMVRFESKNESDTLIEAAELGWWYSASLPERTTVAAFMTDADLIRLHGLHDRVGWQELLARSRQTGERLRGARAMGPPAVVTANSQHLDKVAGAGWAAAGDAAMTFDPLSSQGIVKALRSGKLASFVAVDYLLHGKESQERYQAMASEEYAEYKKAKAAYYALEPRWPNALFWVRRRESPL